MTVTFKSRKFPDGTLVGIYAVGVAEYRVRNGDMPGAAPLTTVVSSNNDLVLGNEVQKVTLSNATSGTFTLTFSGQTTAATAYNAAASLVQTRLENLSNIDPGDVSVSGADGGPYTIIFGGQFAGTNVAVMTVSGASLNAAVNEVQSVKVDATGGSYTLSFGGYTTSPIAFNASATTGTSSVRARLEALTSIGTGQVTVTGGPGDSGGTTPYTVTFAGTLVATNVAQLTGDSAGLTGGGAALTLSTTTPGAPAGTVAVTTPTEGFAPHAGTAADPLRPLIAAATVDGQVRYLNVHI